MSNKFHYVYEIEEIPTNKKYIGSRSSILLPEKDLGFKYFSSSTDKDFKNKQKNNPDDYKYKILSVHDNRKEAFLEEIRLHDFFQVHLNVSFINKAKQTSTYFVTKAWNKGISSPNKGKTYEELYGDKQAQVLKKIRSENRKKYKASEETILKQKNSLKEYYLNNKSSCLGKSKTEEQKEKIRQVSLKQWENKTEEEIQLFKEKRSNYMKNNSITKGKIWVTDGLISKLVNPNDIPENFKKGRTFNSKVPI